MSAADESRTTDDQQLARYLLGLLTDEESQRLDEASIVDDDVALRVRVAEQDLVDAYVTGTLDRDMLDLFESRYLSSPRRRRNVTFARRFLGAIDRAGARPPAPSSRPDGVAAPRARQWPQVMAVAALLLIASGTLLFHAIQLRSGPASAPTRDLERVRESPAAPPPPVALVLRPQTRTIAMVPALAVTAGIDRLAFALLLESNEFPRYRVTLKDPSSDRTVWTSDLIAATSLGQVPAIVVVIPTRLLKSQHYSLVLTEGNKTSPDAINGYTFEVVRR